MVNGHDTIIISRFSSNINIALAVTKPKITSISNILNMFVLQARAELWLCRGGPGLPRPGHEDRRRRAACQVTTSAEILLQIVLRKLKVFKYDNISFELTL